MRDEYYENLQERLKEALSFDPENASNIVEMINEMIRIKVKDACDDLYDRVNKRGRWDPHY